MIRKPLLYCSLALSLLLGGAALAASPAEVRMRVGDVAGALPLAREAAQSRPSDLDAQELYIDLGLSLGLRHHVEALYRERVAQSPGSADAHYLLGRVVPSPSEALTAYERALELEPEHARAPMGIGAVKRALGETEEAEKRYRLSLSRDPALVEGWSGLIATLLVSEKPEQARAEARRFLQTLPDEPDPYTAVATLEPSKAREVLAVGVERVPNDPRLRALYVRSLLDAGLAPEAKVQAARVLELAPGYGEVQFLQMVAQSMDSGRLDVVGWSRLQQAQRVSDAAKARQVWSSLCEAYPNSALPWLGYGKVLGATGDLDGAQQALDKALALRPSAIETRATLGLLHLQRGAPRAALDHLRDASRARPRDASLAVAYLRTVQALGDGEATRALAVQTYQAHPHDLNTALITAKVLSDQGDRKGAYISLREALPRIPDPRLVVALAAAARDAGYYAEAADILQRLGRTLDNETARALSKQLLEEARAAGQVP